MTPANRALEVPVTTHEHVPVAGVLLSRSARIEAVLADEAAGNDPKTDRQEYLLAAAYLLFGWQVPELFVERGVQLDVLNAAYRKFADDPAALEAEIARRWPEGHK